MADNSDDIDEVALNVLLAEGVDLPTAWEASRRDSSNEGRLWGRRGWVIVSLLVITGLVFIALAFY